MTRWLLVLVLALAAGCSHGPLRAPATEALLRDGMFTPAATPAHADDLFALSPAMREYLRQELPAWLSQRGPQLGLVEALQVRGQLRLDYDAEITRNAAQAFDARAGNCLSLLVMTAAFAKELGLVVGYRQVDNGGVWDRNGDLLYSIGHVNLVLERPVSAARIFDTRADRYTIDFMPLPDHDAAHSWPIDEARVVAMYLNNRAVETLTREGSNAAYWWVRAAVRRDPLYADAYNTLGVIYQRHGQAAPAAEAAWRQALELEPGHTHAMGNLADLLHKLGREAEASDLRAALRRLQPVTPLRDYDEGLRALAAGQPARARDLFRRELRRLPFYAELHLNLARAYLQLDDPAGAERHLALARDYSTTRQQQALYAAKLDHLKELRAR